ncbi:MAG: hypothetical protein QXU89_01705 [Desulfurococcaceae archaeon]|uniref:Uncharacterized protein n=1 Tax=Staphylothermus marinus TaxID=2280 RepID=A0A7C4D866_STAMA
MKKYHKVFRNNDSEHIAFLCRVINFIEDVYEDSECSDIKVSLNELNSFKVVLTPFNCKYSIRDSIDIFSKLHNVERIEIDYDRIDSISYNYIYDYAINRYRETLHYQMLRYLTRTITNGYEYYLGVLFNGDCFILEGEKNRVTAPRIPQCISAHTHLSNYPYPSPRDIDEIIEIFIERGLGHVIVAKTKSMAIYRIKPLTDIDLESIKELKNSDLKKLIEYLNKTNIAKISFF